VAVLARRRPRSSAGAVASWHAEHDSVPSALLALPAAA